MAVALQWSALGPAVAAGLLLAHDQPPWAALAALGAAAMLGLGQRATRQGAEAAAEHDHAELVNLLDAVPALLCIIDEEGRYEFANSAHERLHRQGRDGLIGRPLAEAVGPAHYERFRGDVERALAGERVDFEASFPRADGAQQTFGTAYVPRREGDDVTGFYSLSFDISVLKAAERERRALAERSVQAQKFESLGVLAGGIAHDFNNLLGTMRGNLALARRNLRIEEPCEEELTQIEVAARRASELCRQMLGYAGKGQARAESLHLPALVRGMEHLVGLSIPPRVELDLDLAADTPWIRADASQLHQAILALVTNAAEATAESGGNVTLRTGTVRVDTERLARLPFDHGLPPGEYATLQVDDSGGGIGEHTLRRVFDPFFSTKFTGRGLGLTGVLGMMRTHGGAIDLESEVGVGTRVTLFFPIAEAPATEVPRTPKARAGSVEPRRGSGRVVVVDDEDGLRRVMGRILASAGFEPLLAESGQEAIRILDCNPQGSIVGMVLDLTMPGMDGAETLQLVRERDPNLPVLLCSGYTEEEVKQRLEGLSFHGLLAKPFEYEELIDSVIGMAQTHSDG